MFLGGRVLPRSDMEFVGGKEDVSRVEGALRSTRRAQLLFVAVAVGNPQVGVLDIDVGIPILSLGADGSKHSDEEHTG